MSHRRRCMLIQSPVISTECAFDVIEAHLKPGTRDPGDWYCNSSSIVSSRAGDSSATPGAYSGHVSFATKPASIVAGIPAAYRIHSSLRAWHHILLFTGCLDSARQDEGDGFDSAAVRSCCSSVAPISSPGSSDSRCALCLCSEPDQ